MIPLRRAASGGRLDWAILALLMLAAFAVRVWQFGNPLIQSDDPFYLLVGQRMWEGAWPYIDIWDRKPVGLFVLYALLAKLGTGVYPYQIAATLFAAGTAYMIFVMARELASRRAAALAALAYLPALNLIGGDGGQTPVFYNLLMVVAAFLVIKALQTAEPWRIFRLGAVAMLLVGISLQIKYSAVFEGVFFGLALMWGLWRCRPGIVMFAGASAGWASIALIPTALALLVYSFNGHAWEFVYANFVSIFERNNPNPFGGIKKLGHLILLLLPFWLAAGLGAASLWKRRDILAIRFVCLWLAASIVGVCIMGDFYDHYALPVLVPVGIVVATLFDSKDWRRWLGYFLIAFGIVAGGIHVHQNRTKRGNADQLEVFTQAIGRDPPGCLYIFQGPSALYSQTASCLVTRYAFPTHLVHRKEVGAIGVSQTDELKRIMENPPRFVLIRGAVKKEDSPASIAEMQDSLRRSYRPVLRSKIGKPDFVLYKLKESQATIDGYGTARY